MPPSRRTGISLPRTRAHGNGLHPVGGQTSCDHFCAARGGSFDGFRMPSNADLSTGTVDGVRKPPRNETAGSRAPGGSASAMGNWLAPLSEHGPEHVAPARRTPKLELGRMRRAARLRRNRADLEPLRADFAEPHRCQPWTGSLNTLQ